MAHVLKPEFREATRSQAKASIAIQGLSGRGKSGLALLIAYVLSDESWAEVFATDTENRSLDLFENINSNLGISFGKFRKFDLLQTHTYRPTNYLACKEAAKEAGAKALVQDSITHMWNGKGGVLQLVSAKEAANRSLNKYSAWGDPEVVLEKDTIFELIRDPDIHIISTIRVKEKFEIVAGDNNKSSVRSLGEQQQQMPDLKYEPDLVLDMVSPGNAMGKAPRAVVIKSRYAIFTEGEAYDFDLDTLRQLRDYLNEGVDPAVLLEQQRSEFVREITYILDNDASKRTVWGILKAEIGYTEIAIEDMPLDILRRLLSRLIN